MVVGVVVIPPPPLLGPLEPEVPLVPLGPEPPW
jgi:hypothetical protein